MFWLVLLGLVYCVILGLIYSVIGVNHPSRGVSFQGIVNVPEILYTLKGWILTRIRAICGLTESQAD